MRARRYTILIADRSSGVVRRITISLRPTLAVVSSILILPILIGLGAKWSARAEIDDVRGSNTLLQEENGSYRAATGALPDRPARFRDEPHVGVVIASRGYPETAENNQPIVGLELAAAVPGAMVFHAGTARRDNQIVTAGGRVLTVVGRGRSHREAIETAYRAASHIRFDGMQLRRDIGQKALVRLRQGSGAQAGS